MNGDNIAIDQLHKMFRLDPSSGQMFWRVHRGRVTDGTEAGHRERNGYVSVFLFGKRVAAHRIVFAMTHGRWPTLHIDHINGAKSDNRPENLREATIAENGWNRGAAKKNALGVKGVHRLPNGRYLARARVRGKQFTIGAFATVAEAAEAHAKFVAIHHGEFARSAA